MSKTKISIIEDNKVIRDNLSAFIKFHEEFEMIDVHGTVNSFYEYLIVSPSPDILVLDIGLPGTSGLDAIPTILKYAPDLNIVMLTTYEEEDVIVKALCAGACSYISKKASLEEIVDALRIVAAGGSYMSPSIAREIVNHLMGGKVSKSTMLTERQKQIIKKLVDGKSYQVIALELFLSVETIRSHVKKLYKVLQVNNKTEAINQYMKGNIK